MESERIVRVIDALAGPIKVFRDSRTFIASFNAGQQVADETKAAAIERRDNALVEIDAILQLWRDGEEV